MSLPKISVIIPTYNREITIERSIKSVLNQTYQNWELIIIDDGSTDNTKNIINPYLNSKRIKYFYKKNGGVATARNLGIKKSNGDYIAFLDSDDECLPKRLEIQLNEMKNLDSDFSICNSYDILENKKIITRNYSASFKFDINYFLKIRIPHSTSFFMINRDILKKISFDQSLSPMEDTDLIMEYLKEERILLVKYPLVRRYKTLFSDRLSSNYDLKIKGYKKMLIKLRKNYYKLDIHHLKEQERFILYQLGLFELLRGNYFKGRNYFSRVLNRPNSPIRKISFLGLYVISYSPSLFMTLCNFSKILWSLGILKT